MEGKWVLLIFVIGFALACAMQNSDYQQTHLAERRAEIADARIHCLPVGGIATHKASKDKRIVLSRSGAYPCGYTVSDGSGKTFWSGYEIAELPEREANK